ncbi:hypothetical protein [Streptomyces sp. NBC_01361]|uniref:hypothetical protein n=1 Tax=Streptomyces sp. NBC_01361 TaxID=2903838 RepID=UPI002E34AF07|nr:hypothetical protein [Streptomyces sp. NBC_01361]
MFAFPRLRRQPYGRSAPTGKRRRRSAPRALGPLALACLAFDSEFPVDSTSPYLPKCLLDRAWYGEFAT